MPLCRQFNLHTVQLEANIASVKLFLWAEVGLLEWKSDLDFFDYSVLLDCYSVSFIPGFSRGTLFFPLCQERVQTKRGILDQVHVPVAIVFHGDLPRILCQRGGLTASQHCSLILGLQVKGLLAGAVNSVLLLRANTHTQAHDIVCEQVVRLSLSDIQTHQHSECSLAFSRVDWSGELSILALIVLFYALAQGSLWAYAGRGWMRMHAWSSRQRVFSGQMRRWRASSA